MKERLQSVRDQLDKLATQAADAVVKIELMDKFGLSREANQFASLSIALSGVVIDIDKMLAEMK